MRRMKWLVLAAFALPGLAMARPAIARPATAATRCDRACLSSFITRYLDAMAAHDPARLPLAPHARFTENAVAIPFGEALWATFTGLGSYRQDYVDTEAQQVASIVAVAENGTPALMSIRLRIIGGRISEIETVINRSNRGAAAMQVPDPLWEAVEPAAARLTRAQLAAAAEGYARAVAASDSRYVSFNKQSCIRFENSSVMARLVGDPSPGPSLPVGGPDSWTAAVAKTIPMDCAKQIDTGIYGFITSYDNFRAPVIDVERQVVFGQWNFRRRGLAKGVTFEGKFYQFGEGQRFPNENLLGEAFKLRDGGITRVQGVFYNANTYMTGTGWPGGHDGPVSPRR